MNLHHFFKRFVKELSADTILDHTQKIWEKNRFFNFDQYNETAEFVLERLQEYGLQTEIIDLPADGETGFADAIFPHAWNCDEASIELIKPIQRNLCTRTENPCCVGMWSPSTEEEGLEAEVVLLEKGDPAELETKEVQGKWILTPGRPHDLRKLASEKEAAGILSYWQPYPNARNETQWINRNTDTPGGWGTLNKEKPMILIALSPEIGEDLAAMAKEQTLSLKVRIKARMESGALPLLHAFIPGEKEEQEVLILSPLYGQGANYNAAGVASMIECARVLQHLCNEAQINKPNRTIRFLFGPKQYGVTAFAHDSLEIVQKTLYALCLETGVGDPDQAWCRWSFQPTPSALRHFSNGMIWTLSQQYLNAWRPQRYLEKRPFSLVSEVFLNDPVLNVPTTWLHGGTSVECKNTSIDKYSLVDRRSCIDLAAISGAALYMGASAGIHDIPQLALWNYNLAIESILEDTQSFMDQAVSAASMEEINKIYTKIHKHFPLRVRSESRALQSLDSLSLQASQTPEWDSVEELTSALHDHSDSSIALLRSRLEAKAEELGFDSTRLEIQDESENDTRVPRRINDCLGTLFFDSLPAEQWKAPLTTSPRNNRTLVLAWWLADGQRTIDDIEQELGLEMKQHQENLTEWFTTLENLGYISFEPLPEEPEVSEEEQMSFSEPSPAETEGVESEEQAPMEKSETETTPDSEEEPTEREQ